MKVLIFIFLVSFIAKAQEYTLDGKDITPAVKYYKKFVTPLTKSITVYNWSQNADRGDSESQIFWAAQGGKSFWYNYGKRNDTGSVYGFGLYTAMDPVASQGFGGLINEKRWRLLEMKLPLGFRLLDFPGTATLANNTPDEVISVLTTNGCPTMDPERLFQNGGQGLNPNCAKLVKKIFQDILQIDGFGYFYGVAVFKACAATAEDYYNRGRAIVITENRWMNADNIEFYTPGSTKNLKERIRLQTLFLETNPYEVWDAQKQVLFSELHKSQMLDFLNKHPEHAIHKATASCEADQCKITITFCTEEKFCEDLILGQIPRPEGSTITTATAKKKGYPSLLWDDLEGLEKTETIQEWILDNVFGCDGNKPYKLEAL